jgi:hypothetical protein
VQYEIIVSGDNNERHAFTFDFNIENATVATIAGISLHGTTSNQTLTTVDYADNNSRVTVDTHVVTNTDVIATVSITGIESGTTDLLLSNVTATDTNGNTYSIDTGSPGTVVVGDGAAPNLTNSTPAQDLNNDGKYEDVNGDGTFDIVDVNAFFRNYQNLPVQNNTALFDFNEDGQVNVVDVSWLLQTR